MSFRSGATLVVALAAVVALMSAADVSAGNAGLKGKARGPKKDKSFSLSAQYTGYLGESLKINNVKYAVAPETKIHMLGQGLVPLGTMVLNRSIYISGEREGKSMLVRTIIVRPAVTDADDSGSCGVVTDPHPPM